MPQLRALLHILLALLLALPAFAPAQAEEPAAKTIALTVDFGDGSQKQFTDLPWKEGLTVFEALQATAKRRCGVEVAHRGTGATLFVLSLDDIKNEGGGGKNWRFHVNEKLADRSCAVYQLKPGDAVLWKFETGL